MKKLTIDDFTKNLDEKRIFYINNPESDLEEVRDHHDLIIVQVELSLIEHYISFLSSLNLRIKKNTAIIIHLAHEEDQLKRYIISRKYLFSFRAWIIRHTQSNFLFKKLFDKSKSILYIPELIGSLFFLGFSVENEFSEGRNTFIKCEKVSDFDKSQNDKTYGLLIRLKRLGKNNKEILVYKIRTMFPYSEFSQEYYIKKNKLGRIGKILDDPRITNIGRVLRKYYIDEIPQLFQVLAGTLSLVGLRPISKVFLKQYPADIIKLRSRFKPGVLPVTATEQIRCLEDIYERERIYINSKINSDTLVDVRYFFKVLFYIFSGNRSS